MTLLLLLTACTVPVDPTQACAVFDAASRDLVSPETDAELEQALLALAQTAERDDVPPALRRELRERYLQLARFAQQRSRQRSQRVKDLVKATLTAFPDHTFEVRSATEPLTETPTLEEEATALVQRLAHERGRQRKMLGQIEPLCHP